MKTKKIKMGDVMDIALLNTLYHDEQQDFLKVFYRLDKKEDYTSLEDAKEAFKTLLETYKEYIRWLKLKKWSCNR